MKKVISILMVMMVFSSIVFAYPLTDRQNRQIKSYPQLRGEMNKMILSIADLDILVNRNQVADFDIFKEDAQRILDAVAQMRTIDATGIFKSFIDDLERPTKKLLSYSNKKDKKAMEYPEVIFNACFNCHKAHRSY